MDGREAEKPNELLTGCADAGLGLSGNGRCLRCHRTGLWQIDATYVAKQVEDISQLASLPTAAASFRQ